MKGLYTTLLAAIALLVAMPVNAQTEYQLYGHLVGTREDNGIYQLTTESTSPLTVVQKILYSPDYGIVKVKDRYYFFVNDDSGYGAEMYMYIYNASDFTYITRHKVPADMVSIGCPIAYDATTDKVYSIYKDGSTYKLCTLELDKHNRKDIGTLSSNFLAIAFNGEGKLYGINSAGKVGELSTADAAFTEILSTGMNPLYQQSAAFPSDDNNTFYWAATLDDWGGTPGIYKIDLKAKTSTLLREFKREEEFGCLWVGDKVVAQGAPAAATDLAADFANGELTGKINFTAPEKTYGGQTLTGDLTYKVLVDGVENMQGSTQAGKATTAEVTTTQGLHDFAVIVINAEGDGDKAEIKNIYVGHDTPKQVQNVKLVQGDAADKLTLTWDAATEGMHNGYVDPTEVKYQVRKMPSGEIVDNAATSPFKYTVTQEKAEKCFFDVTPYIDNDHKGMPTASNKVMIGKPFEVPYTATFDTNDEVLLFTIEHIGDGNAYWDWDYDYKFMKIYSSTAPKDDWLFTPFIAVEEGSIYKLSFDIRTVGTEKYEVKYGLAPEAAAMTEQLAADTEVESDKFATRSVEFTANKTAAIYIGFHANTTNVEKAMNFYLDNIRLEKVGTTAIGCIPATTTDANLRIADGGFYVLDRDTHVSVARIDGTTVLSRTVQAGQHVSLPKGIYIVCTANAAQKVVVR
ncbi:choice-of-anchor J domain-containing protein [Prevotella nigrescens]|uniref:choice-of-anchor J domain-containing protein n=1 Tax=Prevotella nigrescens TaxID=28133 RepID=UPI00241DDC32|nr:choice-of-anchor J domain-containing protein [Prevotella nigrescens]